MKGFAFRFHLSKKFKGLGRAAALGLFSITIAPIVSPTPVQLEHWAPPPPIFAPKGALKSATQQAGTAAPTGALPPSASSGVSGPSAPSGAPSPSPSLSPIPRSMTQAEKIIMLSEFKSAQRSQLAALRHQQNAEIQELRSSQKARRKEAELQEKAELRKFFAEHPKGPDRRQFVQGLIERRKTRDQMLSDELANRRRENEIRMKALMSDQAQRIKEFQAALDRNEHPPESLWSFR